MKSNNLSNYIITMSDAKHSLTQSTPALFAVTIQKIRVIDSKYRWAGYEFTMSDKSKNITCKISNSQNCCEKYGIYTKSVLQDFIGAEYHSVNVTKRIDNPRNLLAIVEVSIHTNRGVILLQLYNEHNGYYPHDFFTQTEHSTKIESL